MTLLPLESTTADALISVPNKRVSTDYQKSKTKEFQYKYLLNFTEVKFTSVNFNAPEATRGMFFQRSTYDYLKLIID